MTEPRLPQLVERFRHVLCRRVDWRPVAVALSCASLLIVSDRLGAADGLERLRADVPVTRSPSAIVKVTDHAVPSVAPIPGPDQPRTLLDLFSSWMSDGGQDQGSATPAVKIEPRPVQGRADLVVVPEGAPRDAIVPIDPAPKNPAATPPAPPTLAGSRVAPNGQRMVPLEAEPAAVLTTRLVSTALVTASLWGKSVSAEEGQGDELDRLASATARRLDRPLVPASRRLVERARPPLKAGRVTTTNQGGIDLLTPIEPAAAPAIN